MKYLVGWVFSGNKVAGEIHDEEKARELYEEARQKGIDCVFAKILRQHGEG